MIERISFRMRTNKTKNANINQLIVFLGRWLMLNGFRKIPKYIMKNSILLFKHYVH